ncbi:GAF and ANTAR domain-containing protein [Streptomyces sp. NPDC096094]|uniref:GAF and ANTAR domain-containing protein n=1 Tax=unclassified Streptomyces TaxID=2593676 RepID=UPI00382D8FEF
MATEYTEMPIPAAADGTAEYPQRGAVEARNRRLAHAGIARAEELVLRTYRLPSREGAFDLLRQTSQRFNVKLHTLADVAAHLPAPPLDAPGWSVGRRPLGAAPALPALPTNGTRPGSQSAVLRAALRRVLHVTDTHMGNVQLVENGLLRMEEHSRLNRRFTDYFAFVEDSTTSCARAAEQGRQVTVKDVAASDAFDEESRQTILQAGSRACHSVPLLGPNGTVVGMISSHHESPLGELAPAQLAQLHDLGRQVGRWLLWYRGTVVLNALDHLHAAAGHRR